MAHPKYKKIGDVTVRLMEEVGELLQAASKGERFGWLNHYPDDNPYDNLTTLQKEWTDLNDVYAEYLAAIIKGLENDNKRKS